MKTLYVTDLDGTLLHTDRMLTDYTCRTINQLVEQGHAISLATARSWHSARMVAGGLRLRLPAVMMNGVMLTNLATGKHSNVNLLTPYAARLVIQAFETCGRPPTVYSLEDGQIDVQYKDIQSDYERDFIRARRDRYHKFEQVHCFDADRHIIYVNALCLPDVAQAICNKLRWIEGIRTTRYLDIYSNRYEFVEVFASGAGKWNGVQKLKALYGFARVVAFGDNKNDLELLRRADYGIAVANADSEVLAAADEIIGPNTCDSVAHYLADHLTFAEKT